MVTEAEKRRVGALIRHRRQVLDLDQPELAERVGVSRQTVSKWETGQSYPERYAGKVEAVLGISLTGDREAANAAREKMLLHDSIDRMDVAELARLVEAYRAIKDGTDPRRRRAG